ncbi:MAG: nuclear transport factor 2 family protein [Chloroflexi bacterium]|nr:nuclear transport factor 2 family protein [Chloroflexota bacterium]
MSQVLDPAHAFSRRLVLRSGLAGAAVSLAGVALAPASLVAAQVEGPTTAVAQIYELQSAFHRAKTTQDLDLMMSLWAPDSTLASQGDPNSPYVGSDSLRAFWLGSGSWKSHRLSLVPSFKIRIDVKADDEAWLYFECHDVADYDQPSRSIIADLFMAGTVKNVDGSWQFWNMTSGSGATLSPDHYYFSA